MLNLNNRFSQSPDVNIQRSTFPRKSDIKFSMSSGLLYPCYVDEVLPGDTFDLSTNVFARMSTPIHPVMDNCYMDIFYFYVPYRLVWDHWKEFMGEPQSDPYAEPTEYTIPALLSYVLTDNAKSKPAFRSVADYMGLPPNQPLPPNGVSALPFRAYALIWNEWFRAQTIQSSIEFSKGDEDVYIAGAGSPGILNTPGIITYFDPEDYTLWKRFIPTAAYGGYLAPVNKDFDYFTSVLREPQNGDPVAIPLSGFAPVIPLDQTINPEGFTTFNAGTLNEFDGDAFFGPANGESGTGIVATLNNSFADLSAIKQYSPIVANISDLRYAFQMQRFLEKDNFGHRYTEVLKNHFGVTAPDASLQRPELLSARRIRVNMNQVLQTSSTDGTSPQGNTAAYSATMDRSHSFTKSFTEHGVVIGLAAVRCDHTYQQGVERMWCRKDKFDFYFPEFAHISNQPVYNYEIYSQGNDEDYEVFGFQEAWAEYRYKPSRIAGEMRSTYPQSLDIWHYGDDYDSKPTLTTDWLVEPRNYLDRTLAVDSSLSDQFIVDMYFDLKAVRPMPVYSIPGLADHF